MVENNRINIDYMICANCNLCCPFCYGPNININEINFRRKKILLKGLYDNGVNSIVIGGGEPLLSKDISKIAKYSKKIGLRLGIQTNGYFPKPLFKILKYFDWIGIPFDGLSLNSQRKMKTDINHVENTINICTNLNRLIKEKGLRTKIKIGTVVSSFNIKELKEISKIISNINPDVWKIYQIRPRGRGKNIDLEYLVSPIDVINEIKAIKKKNNTINIYYTGDNPTHDAYLVVNPDTQLIVISGNNEIQLGYLILKNKFQPEILKNGINRINIKNHQENINKSFPGW